MYVDSSVIMGMTGEYDEGSKGLWEAAVHGLQTGERLLPRPLQGGQLLSVHVKGKNKLQKKSPAGLCCPACTALAHDSGRRGS